MSGFALFVQHSDAVVSQRSDATVRVSQNDTLIPTLTEARAAEAGALAAIIVISWGAKCGKASAAGLGSCRASAEGEMVDV